METAEVETSPGIERQDWGAASQGSPPVLVLDEFLVRQELNSLMRYVLDRESAFQATRVINSHGGDQLDAQYRRSRVLFSIDEFERLFADRLSFFLPHVLWRLDMEPFPVSRIEIQLTASNHGEFFRQHIDNGSDSVSRRALTFVHFFYREPKPYSGGQLRVFDYPWPGQRTADAAAHVIEPQQNQIVFFQSNRLHEIFPVDCPSGEFADSRFTVNGWFHR
jgi:SM-20-related protein